MPLFEFLCKSCGKKFTALVGVIAEATPPACPKCGATNLSRLMSRFSTARSEEEMLESLADPDKLGDLEDPASMRRFVKEMGSEMGEELGDEFEEYVEKGGDAGEEDADDGIY
ncbi:MAG: zinc ribbon domain-containing protein [Armatimonadota bacterium]|nr:zinc ribbon domain-containing protein [Armatimonadota bacterium]